VIAQVLINKLADLDDPEDLDVWIYLPPDGEHERPIPIIARADRVAVVKDGSGLSAVLVAEEDDGAFAIVPEQRVTRIQIRERVEA
jgi:hypothetical protein